MMLSIVLLSILAFASATPDTLDWIPRIEEFAHQELLADLHPDARLDTLELVSKYGFNGELHEVITTDGYILELHRIRGRANSSVTDNRPVALVMPGLLASSAAWVLSGPEKGLGYILSDAGYDVWLGNVRGSKYSRKHISSSISPKDYWNFSWHEIGTRDLPAMIDYILKSTGREKLFYLAHSQGSTVFFVMTSELPKYQEKIQAMFAMAPVAYCSRMISPVFRLLAKFSNSLYLIAQLIGFYKFEPTGEGMRRFQALVCAKDAITQPLCSNVLFLISGYNVDQLNKTLLPIILGHIPAGASTKQFMHYAQLIKNGKFRQYDYGFIHNIKVYRKLTPPAYDLKKIQVPVSLHYSTNDWLSHVRDVHQLYHELGNPLGKFRVPHSKFNHLDFMWAKDVKELLYDKILSLMWRFRD